MNFNLDDPLGDLLSDNSNDNDSFFDNQPGRKKITSKQQKTTTTARTSGGKGKMEDLFGIKEESEPQFKVPQIRTNVNPEKKDEKPLATSTPNSKTKTNENVDIFSDLGFDPKNPKSTVASKSSLFDDILSSIDLKKPNSSPSLKIDEQNVRRDDAIPMKGTISRQSTETTDNSGIQGQVRPKTSTGRRSSTASPAKNNPLDLFSSSKENDNWRVSTPKSRKKGSTVDWLGLGTDPGEEPSRVEVEVLRVPEDLPKEDILEINEDVHDDILTVNDIEHVASISLPMNNSMPHLVLSSNVGAQNVSQIIEQQVTQLNLASQMKNQEVALMEMQRRQHQLLSRQEAQFNELLQKQISRQNQLEQSIKAQQDRINAHIQFLMSQPIVSSYSAKDTLHLPDEENNNEDKKDSVAIIELQADMKRLELEKLRVEDLVSTISANYEKEIELIEKSLRKQIEVLEDHLASVENRLKKENDTLNAFYTSKLKTANDEKQEMQSRLEQNLNDLRTNHEDEIRRLKTTYDEDLDTLKDDHRKMIESIRQSKLLEFSVVQENGSYLEVLRLASSNLETATGDLQSLRAEIENKIDVIYQEREKKIDIREKKVEESDRRIQLIENANEEEKKRLLDLVTTLECQLAKLSKDSSEENWIMRQKMASLEADKITFEKEKSLIREQIAKDEKRIEDLKESQLIEKQKLMEEIHEERVRLNVEKAKIETSKKLESNSNLEQSRQELEASLQVAQDVTRQADIERERFLKLQRQLDTQKRALMEKENAIHFKEEELEQSVQQARSSERRAYDATQKSRSAEQSFNEKITFLQQKLRELSEKESRLSQERLNLSQERIEVQNLKSKLEQNKCSLCRIGEPNKDVSEILRSKSGIDGISIIDNNQYTMLRTSNDVDRLLDENVLISLERMKDFSNRNWSEPERTFEATRPFSNSDVNLDFEKYNPIHDFLGN